MFDQGDMQEFLADAQENLEHLFDGAITLAGVPYDVAIMRGGDSVAYSTGYDNEAQSLTFRLRTALHPDEPAARAKVEYEGEMYRVVEVTRRPYEAVWHVVCAKTKDLT